MAKKNQQANALAALAFVIVIIGGGLWVVPDNTPEYDLTKNPFGTLPDDEIHGNEAPTDGECNDMGIVGTPIDEDGDGVANEFDPTCIYLTDTDLNGVCDQRVWATGNMELGQDYFMDNCAGWE